MNRYVSANKPVVSHLENRARMLISCPDRNGIVAAVSQFLYEYGANIVQSDQYTADPEGGMFFIRIEFDLEHLESRLVTLEKAFAPIVNRFEMDCRIERAVRKKRLAIFVSKEDHALLELLWQWQSGELYADIAMVVSNHTIMQDLVESYGIPFVHIPVTPDTKAEAEKKQLEVTCRCGRLSTLYADYLTEFIGQVCESNHQHSSFILAGLYWRESIRAGVQSRCKDHWCNFSLCDRRT